MLPAGNAHLAERRAQADVAEKAKLLVDLVESSDRDLRSQIGNLANTQIQGVTATHIIDGRQKHSLLMELLTDEGVGTMITG